MSPRPKVALDANEAVAWVAHQLTEVIAIYPITPSSGMGEWADQWSAEGRTNLWGAVPLVQQMQSEGGAAGAVHGAIQTGALTTTFTASQGLLLMIPSMYKIAGELSPTVFHVSARSVAAQALSIFGDHSDVMAARGTGFAFLASNSVQEAMDFALIAHAATLESRVPFLHFFDGFRTSHEIMKIEPLAHEELRALVRDDLVRAHRARALSPERPFIRGTAQNPDVFFQARESVNRFYLAVPDIVQSAMDRLGSQVGRHYRLFDYVGAPDAERVIVVMGSGAEVVEETVDHLVAAGDRVGLVKVRLYRPFAADRLVAAIPTTARRIAVLDRTKEPGSAGEPLYLDVVTALAEAMEEGRTANRPRVVGGRFGLSSKEFTPAMVKGVFDELARPDPRNHFTVGIRDDVTGTSLEEDRAFSTESPETVRALFYGLGADGTVGANKNSIKIIAEETDFHAQGYFVYDSKKSGSVTVSHLRFGPRPIRSAYLIGSANFIACHQFSLLQRQDVLRAAAPGATFLLNSPHGADEVWGRLPRTVQERIIELGLRFYVIDASRVARETGMGARINTIMQPCFFVLSGVLPRDEAIAAIKRSIEKTYGKRGAGVVAKNFASVDAALEHLEEVRVPETAGVADEVPPAVPPEAPDFVRRVLAEIIAGRGDELPVSAFPPDGTYPSATARWEKRDIASEIPVWDPEICIKCGKCVLVCPHAVIRAKVYDPAFLEKAPASFRSTRARWKDFGDARYTLQVSPQDCTGCALCVEVCPVKNKRETRLKAINMESLTPRREAERRNWDFFVTLPEMDRTLVNHALVKDTQLLEPLFEFSGACAGCGETPYLKLLSQLFGDRALIANATGCSSIYGGNLPTTPWALNAEGRGPAWSNSLFEDNAEFGLGFRLSIDQQTEHARRLLPRFAETVGAGLVDELLAASPLGEAEIRAQRQRVETLKTRLVASRDPAALDLLALADLFVPKSVWIVGGDGWAYDIGYGGLDYVLASGRNVNVLVLDTEVYSNTGGQKSSATPRGAVAKFAAGGKSLPKKDLALLAMAYRSIYVARVAMGASDAQTLRAFREAESFDGPSLIIAYSHCIAHGIDMAKGMEQQRLAVESGHWPLLRYDPRRIGEGLNPLVLDSKPPSTSLRSYVEKELRFTILAHTDPEASKRLLAQAEADNRERWETYQEMARLPASAGKTGVYDKTGV